MAGLRGAGNPAAMSETTAALRSEVREFLDDARSAGRFTPDVDAWFFGFDPEFTKALARRGWIGMTWPREYGGGGRSAHERLVVIEELLAAGAPMNAHWVSDRQMGPSLLRYGSEEQRMRFLPAIVQGELYTAIGMSERGSGSDLSSVSSRAVRVPGGWSLTGSKIWMGNAHRAHVAVVLCRTSEDSDRSQALSQLIVDLSSPGISVRPIITLLGTPHFCEVQFTEVFVPDGMLLGREGDGWEQVTAELAVERGGPERMLSTFPLLARVLDLLGGGWSDESSETVGRLSVRLIALRRMASALVEQDHSDLIHRARIAAFKELGTRFEADLTDAVRDVVDRSAIDDPVLGSLLRKAILTAPAASLRGGTTEIMRGIIARAVS